MISGEHDRSNAGGAELIDRLRCFPAHRVPQDNQCGQGHTGRQVFCCDSMIGNCHGNDPPAGFHLLLQDMPWNLTGQGMNLSVRGEKLGAMGQQQLRCTPHQCQGTGRQPDCRIFPAGIKGELFP